MASCQAAPGVAVIVVWWTRLGDDRARSQISRGEAVSVTVTLCVTPLSAPYLSTGYSVAVPKSHGSSLPVCPSTFTSQFAYMALPVP